VTPSVAAPSDTNVSDATEFTKFGDNVHERKAHHMRSILYFRVAMRCSVWKPEELKGDFRPDFELFYSTVKLWEGWAKCLRRTKCNHALSTWML